MAKSNILPTRTTADTNAPADINTLSERAIDYQGTEQITQLTAETSPATGDFFIMERATDGALRKVTAANMPGSGTKAQWVVDLPAGAFDFPSTNYAPWNRLTGTNRSISRHLFDATTVEYLEAQFRLPPDMDDSGDTDIFLEIDFSREGGSSGSVAWGLQFCPIPTDDTEAWDQAYDTSNVFPAVTCAVQGRVYSYSNQGDAAVNGFVADGLVRVLLWRNVSTDTLASDASFFHLRIRGSRA